MWTKKLAEKASEIKAKTFKGFESKADAIRVFNYYHGMFIRDEEDMTFAQATRASNNLERLQAYIFSQYPDYKAEVEKAEEEAREAYNKRVADGTIVEGTFTLSDD